MVIAVNQFAPGANPVRADASLDRQVLIASAAIWLAHFGLMISRGALDEIFRTDSGTTLARFLVACGGIGVSGCLHQILKRRQRSSSLRSFVDAILLSVLACAVLTLGNEFAMSRLSPPYLEHPEHFLDRRELIFTYSFFLWVFVAWSAIYATLTNAQRLREEERRAAAAVSAANTARLQALQLQVQPHFLFNTLNTLSGLVGLGRTAEAEQVILDLAGFLRQSLTSSPNQLVTLRDELQVQRTYLDIERVRFADRLHLVLELEEECLDALAPALILQPLVENAIKHGLARSAGALTMTIGARREHDVLRLWVEDRREGASGCTAEGLGMGLSNVRERLQALFGGQARLTARATASGWLSAIELPWATAR